MKIYFSAAITYRDKMLPDYKKIKQAIIDLKHEYLEAYDVLGQDLKYVLSQSDDDSKKYLRHWKKIVSSADVAVIEASFPSTVNMGFEINSLIEMGKPVILVYQKGKNPTFLGESHSTKLIKMEYSLENIYEVLEYGLGEAEVMLDRRFTMIITSKIDDHLKKMLESKKISRSAYIRDLIREDMEEK